MDLSSALMRRLRGKSRKELAAEIGIPVPRLNQLLSGGGHAIPAIWEEIAALAGYRIVIELASQ